MKRDIELIRKILLWMENNSTLGPLSKDIEIDDYDIKTIGYHCWILTQAELIDNYIGETLDNEYHFYVTILTWKAHELLDKIRNDTIWENAKKLIERKKMVPTMDALATVAESLIKIDIDSITSLMESFADLD